MGECQSDGGVRGEGGAASGSALGLCLFAVVVDGVAGDIGEEAP